MVFSLTQYSSLLDVIIASKKPVLTIEKFLRAPQPGAVLLRHDVDRKPSRSVALAKIEAEKGLSATYYFRVTPAGQTPIDDAKLIHSLGHECGYHYEVLSDCKGNIREADKLFASNLAVLREAFEVNTVSMHGAPLSPHDNQAFGDQLDFSAYGLLGDAVRTVEPHRPFYFTDTGGMWADGAANLRDRVGTDIPPCQPDDPEFAEFVKSATQPIYISTHPERWPNSLPGKVQTGLQDAALNMVKKTLSKARN